MKSFICIPPHITTVGEAWFIPASPFEKSFSTSRRRMLHFCASVLNATRKIYMFVFFFTTRFDSAQQSNSFFFSLQIIECQRNIMHTNGLISRSLEPNAFISLRQQHQVSEQRDFCQSPEHQNAVSIIAAVCVCARARHRTESSNREKARDRHFFMFYRLHYSILLPCFLRVILTVCSIAARTVVTCWAEHLHLGIFCGINYYREKISKRILLNNFIPIW